MRQLEIFGRFLRLGLTSFGGPIAHLGYFREAFVERLGWLDEEAYARLIALCQFLPGPASSQVGFAIGLSRGGLGGGIAAFVGFTLPSAALMLGLALLEESVTRSRWFAGCIAGLELLAVVVVAHAVAGMAASFWRSRVAKLIGLLTATLLVAFSSLWLQIGVLACSALLGSMLGLDRDDGGDSGRDGPVRGSERAGRAWALVAVGVGLVALPLLAGRGPLWSAFDDMFRVGSLVFGGGHVVLPLLQSSLPQVGVDEFLVGYAAAQGVPGPMFSLSTYLGAVAVPASPLAGAAVATAGIFLPGFLLLLGLEDRWQNLATRPRFAAAMAGIHAAVVGLLLAALVAPIVPRAISSFADVALVVVGFWLLRWKRVGILWLVLAALVAGLSRALLFQP